MSEASRDQNHVPTALGVSSVDSVTPTPFKVNPVTGRLLTDVSGGGSGTVTSVSVVSANGFAGTVATATTTPAITLTTTITGILKGDGTAVSAATDGTDYLSSTTGLKLNQTSAQTITNDTPIFNTLTASELVATTAAKKLQSLAVATYPSLTEISYVKGVTSSLQTQLNAKQATITFGTGVQTALGVNIGSAGAPVLFNGALGTPSSGTVTNLTGTASININGTVGATTPTTGVFTTLVAGSTTSLLLGTAGSAVGNIGFRNATSGTITLAPVTGALGTVTLTLPAATDTVAALAATQTFTNKRITKRTGTTTSSATPTINTNNVDFYSITAQTVDITSFTTNLSGTPTEGQTLWIAITGTAARAITWGASFEASTVALPTTTVTTNRLDVGFVWNSVTSKWRCIASA